MKYIKPNKLQAGDTVAVLSPSWGGPEMFPHIYENGIKVLEEKFGLKVKEFLTTRMPDAELSANPKIRADDIHAAFLDPEVKAIFASIGGDDSIRVLQYMDKKIIMDNPKIFMGYSDTTTYNLLFNQWGLVTLNGPAVMAGFSQMENFPLCEEHIRNILFDNPESYVLKPYSEYVDTFPDWGKVENTGKIGELKRSNPWNWLQGEGIVSGKLAGGCLDVLNMIRGTKFWPVLDYWNDKVLFIETSEDKPLPHTVKYTLRSYGVEGILDRISGILIGRARDYTDEENETLRKNVVEVVGKEFGRGDMPIVTDVDFGHTEPQLIMPLGIEVKIDCEKKEIGFGEKVFGD
jgi:muramoyltetrapeptide carboxypeptidase LdcA involved in peptidoglycan recycling